ncbi:MAG: hypothetical protein JWO84_287 [Parcubacteria group bacterium]|nr:hypothetical protein [Parcubacteria group bacterium]
MKSQKSATVVKLARMHFLMGGLLAEFLLTLLFLVLLYALPPLPYSEAISQLVYVVITAAGAWYGTRFVRSRYIVIEPEEVARLSVAINAGITILLTIFLGLTTWYTNSFDSFNFLEMLSGVIASLIVFYLVTRKYLQN